MTGDAVIKMFNSSLEQGSTLNNKIEEKNAYIGRSHGGNDFL